MKRFSSFLVAVVTALSIVVPGAAVAETLTLQNLKNLTFGSNQLNALVKPRLVAFEAGLVVGAAALPLAGGTMTGAIVFAPTRALTTALDLTDTDIVNALSAAANDLIGTNWTLAGATGKLSLDGGLDRKTAGALVLGGSTSTSVEVSATGETTTVKGPLNCDEAVTFDTSLGVTGATTLSGGATVNTATATDDQVTYQVTPGGAGRFTATISPLDLTANRALRYPDSSGTFALSGESPAIVSPSVIGDIVTFSGITGAQQDSGVLISNVPTMASAASGANLALISGGADKTVVAGKVTLTQPATGSTLTIADGVTLTASNTLTFTGTDGSSVAFGAGGTVAYSGEAPTAHAASHISGGDQIANMVGDSGAGGTHGLVPAPGAGDAAAGKYLAAGGTWSVPTQAFDVGSCEVSLASAVVTAGVGNTGVGSMAVASGTRSGLFEIEIMATGDLGAATYKWRRNGGSWEDNSAAGYTTADDVELTGYDAEKEASVPSGQHVQFAAGGEGDDFAAGDTFAFTPVLECTMNHAGGEITVPLVTPEESDDEFVVHSTEIASGQKVLMECIMQPAAAGGYTDGMPFVNRKTVAAGSITFGFQNMGSALNGKAKMMFVGLPE